MTVEQLKQIFTQKGYKWDPFINVVGIRNLSTGRKVTNKFDDTLVVAYFVNNAWRIGEYKCTTDPGAYYVRKKLLNPKGVAILKAGQYLDTYAIRMHQGKYEALCQTYKKVTVYRDSDKDEEYDLIVTDTGDFGINIHAAGEDSALVENWSAGCQVFKRVKDFDTFMKIVKTYKIQLGNKYTYTLLEL